VRSAQTAEFALTETAYAPEVELPKHSHEEACFVIILQGNFTETFGKRTRFCKPLDVIFRPSDEVHSDLFHRAGGRCLNVEMTPRWLERIRTRSVALKSSAYFRGGLLSQLALRLYKEFRGADAASSLATEGLMLQIAAEASRRSNGVSGHRPPPWLEEAREIIRAQFASRLTHSFIAESVGVHPVHLAATFHQFYRCTIGEYVRRLRIEAACREMSTSDAPLARIALAAGFYDQSHFSRLFKRFTGMTPARYRSLFRAP
jgi:AraC family transcriptional regulator